MQDRDIILAVLQSGIALAGLLLIFAGALLTKAASFETRRGDKYKLLAVITLKASAPAETPAKDAPKP